MKAEIGKMKKAATDRFYHHSAAMIGSRNWSGTNGAG